MSASEGRLLLTIRAQLQSELDTLRGAVAELAARLAKRDGLALEVSYCEAFSKRPTRPALCGACFEACRAAGVPHRTAGTHALLGRFWLVPCKSGPAPFLCGRWRGACAPLHDAMFDFPDEALRTAADVFFAIAQASGPDGLFEQLALYLAARARKHRKLVLRVHGGQAPLPAGRHSGRPARAPQPYLVVAGGPQVAGQYRDRPSPRTRTAFPAARQGQGPAG